MSHLKVPFNETLVAINKGTEALFLPILQLILNSDYENDIQLITDNFEVIFLPIANPDGYVHTHEVVSCSFLNKDRFCNTMIQGFNAISKCLVDSVYIWFRS